MKARKKVKTTDKLGTMVAPLKIFQKSYIKSGNPHLKDFKIIFCEILSVATTRTQSNSEKRRKDEK